MWFGKQIRPSHLSTITDLVRSRDYEGYLSSLLLPNRLMKRTALAVRAFNVELAQIPDVTTNPVAAQGRFWFWSDIVDRIYQSHDSVVLSHPVAAELSVCLNLNDKKLSKRHLKKLIDTRASIITHHDLPFQTLDDVFKYSDGSILPIFSLLIETRNCNDARTLVDLDHIASHVSRTQGLVNILRGLGHNAQRGRCYLPSAILSKHHVSQQDVLRFSSSQQLTDAIYELACAAKNQAKIANSLLKQPSVKPHVSLFLPIVFLDLYLDKLEKQHFNIWSSELYKRRPNLALMLWLKYVRIKYL